MKPQARSNRKVGICLVRGDGINPFGQFLCNRAKGRVRRALPNTARVSPVTSHGDDAVASGREVTNCLEDPVDTVDISDRGSTSCLTVTRVYALRSGMALDNNSSSVRLESGKTRRYGKAARRIHLLISGYQFPNPLPSSGLLTCLRTLHCKPSA